MNTANNLRHQETARRIREALLYYMEQDTEPAVAQICERAGIHRSTFYRHYTDVPDLMEQTEEEIQKGLFRTAGGEGHFLDRLRASPGALEPLIEYIRENRHFYLVYLRSPGRFPLRSGFRPFWTSRILPLFRTHGVESEAHMQYYFDYVKAGFLTVIRRWLENGCEESPRELAEILYHMLPYRP